LKKYTLITTQVKGNLWFRLKVKRKKLDPWHWDKCVNVLHVSMSFLVLIWWRKRKLIQKSIHQKFKKKATTQSLLFGQMDTEAVFIHTRGWCLRRSLMLDNFVYKLFIFLKNIYKRTKKDIESNWKNAVSNIFSSTLIFWLSNCLWFLFYLVSIKLKMLIFSVFISCGPFTIPFLHFMVYFYCYSHYSRFFHNLLTFTYFILESDHLQNLKTVLYRLDQCVLKFLN